MDIAILIHTTNKEKLSLVLDKTKNLKKFSIYLNSENYAPWQDEKIKSSIVSFSKYYAFPTQKKVISSILELLYKVKEQKVIIIDEEQPDRTLDILDKEEILQKNLDTKYEGLKWFMEDIRFQFDSDYKITPDTSDDYQRFTKKISSEYFRERIIYVDGGLGDHVMALPLLEKLSPNIHICCKYPFAFHHINNKGFIHWTDELFGGYGRSVYEYGSTNNSKTIIDAFFGMYGEKRDKTDILIYKGNKTYNSDIPKDKKIALICTSAAKIQNLDSNKDWRDIRWFKLVHELRKKNYYIIQVGSKSDNQIPNVDLKFLDKPFDELSALIEESSLWFSVDTFFHHFASAIKPEVGICLTPFYNDHAKHPKVTYIEKNCGKNYYDRRWWLDLQQPERKECMDLIQLEDVLKIIDY